jgi:glyoxalase-like protein
MLRLCRVRIALVGPRHHTRVIRFSNMLARCRIAQLTLFVVSAAQAQRVPTSVLGKGWGLDHILIGLSDPAVAKETFGTKLGFSVVHGTRFPAPGLEQAIIQLPPAYIELLWPYQKPTKPVGLSAKLIAKRIESGGGPAAYNIDVSPASETAAILRGLGLTVNITAEHENQLRGQGRARPLAVCHDQY